VLDAQVAPVEPPPPSYSAPAAPPPPVPAERGVETHDGVMLRLAVGIGGGVMTDTLDQSSAGFPDEVTFAGGGIMGSVDLGAALTNELTLHGRIALLNILSPRIEADGEEIEIDLPNGDGAAADSDSISTNAMLLAVGLTYNFMPINIYVTAAGGLSMLALSTNDEDVDQDDFDHPTVGFGLNLDVGKEWWVTPQTGIGVAGRFWWATGGAENELTARTIDSDRELLAFGLLFSVTHQ
jgi:hypothetical protein